SFADLDQIMELVDPEIPVLVGSGNMHVRSVGSRDPVPTGPDGMISQDPDLLAEPLRSDEPLVQALRSEVLVLERADDPGEVEPGELLQRHLPVAGNQHRDGSPLYVEQDVLQRRRGIYPQLFRNELDRRGP